MESLASCVLCGSRADRFVPVTQRGEYGVKRCTECGLVFISPREDQGEILRQYTDDVSSPLSYYVNSARFDTLIFEKRLDWTEQFATKGRLIDIGCSVGTFMDVAKKRGWDVTGVELNPNAYELCKKKGHKVYNAPVGPALLEKLDRKDFDLVCLNDVIEHFADPLETMKLVAPLVRDGGMLMIDTPNWESIVARTFQLKTREHLFYFNETTAKRLLGQVGFDVVFVKKAGRRRDFEGLQTGATLDSKAWLTIIKLLHKTGIDRLANFTLENFVTDELFIVAKKRPRAS
jgi:2-polyprenyl-3-methyl-5-hydroxy-6-metoxy-1,4-benzoquinol methylase